MSQRTSREKNKSIAIHRRAIKIVWSKRKLYCARVANAKTDLYGDNHASYTFRFHLFLQNGQLDDAFIYCNCLYG